MSEAVSALAGAAAVGAVAVTETGLRGMVTLRGDLSSEAVKAAVKAAVGLDVPDRRRIALDGEAGVAWMSPDELLLMVPYAQAEGLATGLSKALEGTHHLAVNVSDARAVFRIDGAGAREVLAKGAPVDLSPGAFGPGEIRRTRLGTLAAAFWMTGEDAFELVCFRSVAAHVFAWLETASQEDSLPGYF